MPEQDIFVTGTVTGSKYVPVVDSDVVRAYIRINESLLLEISLNDSVCPVLILRELTSTPVGTVLPCKIWAGLLSDLKHTLILECTVINSHSAVERLEACRDTCYGTVVVDYE
jgi:hypothetical protein